jgi:ribosomal protein L31
LRVVYFVLQPPKYMTVSSFTSTGSGVTVQNNKQQVTCKFNIKVVDKVTGAAVNGPTLAGTWTINNKGTTTSTTTVAGTATGVVTVTYSTRRAAAGSCTFKIDTISHPGYTGGLDATTTLQSGSYSWA